MIEQLSLYDSPGRKSPRARRNDADGSQLAADALERSGRAAAQLQAVLGAVHRHPGSTSRAIAALSGLDRYLVGRRLPELAHRGLVERVAMPGEELRWWPR